MHSHCQHQMQVICTVIVKIKCGSYAQSLSMSNVSHMHSHCQGQMWIICTVIVKDKFRYMPWAHFSSFFFQMSTMIGSFIIHMHLILTSMFKINQIGMLIPLNHLDIANRDIYLLEEHCFSALLVQVPHIQGGQRVAAGAGLVCVHVGGGALMKQFYCTENTISLVFRDTSASVFNHIPPDTYCVLPVSLSETCVFYHISSDSHCATCSCTVGKRKCHSVWLQEIRESFPKHRKYRKCKSFFTNTHTQKQQE